MKKLLIIALIAFVTTSCAQRDLMIPKAVNTVNSVRLSELNLDRKDYKILNTATAEATIMYTENSTGTSIKIVSENNEFILNYVLGKNGWSCKYSGIVKFGYLANDYGISSDILQPEEVARRLAIYRLINTVKQNGADGVIEPVISTNVSSKGRVVTYKTTVSAKMIVLNTDN